MSGSTLRRTVLCVLIVTLVLPLASAYAAPAKRSETGVRAIQLTDLGRTLLRSVDGLLSLFRSLVEQDAPGPPGQQPGNGQDPGNGSVTREGNGLDPHGKP
jgi:hypothetical protein